MGYTVNNRKLNASCVFVTLHNCDMDKNCPKLLDKQVKIHSFNLLCKKEYYIVVVKLSLPQRLCGVCRQRLLPAGMALNEILVPLSIK